ncbi:glycosyltransferase family 2 protein [Alloprevotella tannerae]|uniref:glycosyltransferase family 2 protein n=1 Tax=Alloprevotella tannerae TaxID=76122 RepID=UPI00288BD9EB|nr:glycosyltransferase family 2 protein [Alloprevotella tannerae]
MKITIVVPCYNEEEVLTDTTQQLTAVVKQLESAFELKADVLYVDDGSKDATWEMIQKFAAEDTHIHGLKLAHNVGHQRALWAGLDVAAKSADAMVSIDADLQDDVTVIEKMVARFLDGNDIVYGVRRNRPTDSFFKKWTALAFYKFVRLLGGDVLYNHADFRLMSRRAVLSLMDFPERNLFLRGMVYSLGYPHSLVYYDRRARQAGESKYPFRKMMSFALDGITSFSIKPLRLIVYLGGLFLLFSLLAIVYSLIVYFKGQTLPGWTSLTISLWFIGGTILLALGTIGEYVGKIYAEVKRRPRYIIEQKV